MKTDQIKVGQTYLAKVTDKLVPVRLDAKHPRGGWDATNLATNKKVRIKSAARLRGEARRGSAEADQAQQSAASAKPAPAAAAKSKPAPAAKPKASSAGMSGLDAAAEVLRHAGAPMSCGQIVEAIFAKGLWTSKGKTPEATISAAILREVQAKGPRGRFKKAGRGLVEFNERGAKGAGAEAKGEGKR